MSNTTEIRPGEYADLMPDMSDEEYSALKQSIEQDGLRHPIEVTEDGVIVDGHHRYRACEELGVEPEFTTVDGATVEQAIRANFTRRNLSDGTKREVVESYLEEHYDGEATQREVADALGVSLGTVNNAWKNVQTEQFSKEEKRQQVADYLEANPDASNRKVADAIEADVSHATVGNWRAEWEPDEAEPETPDDEPEPEPETPPEPDDSAPEPKEDHRLGKAIDRIAELEEENEALREQAEREPDADESGASVQVLRRKLAEKNSRVSELEAVVREFVRAVENEDDAAIQEVADRASGLVDD